jgi:hypothetical protein
VVRFVDYSVDQFDIVMDLCIRALASDCCGFRGSRFGVRPLLQFKLRHYRPRPATDFRD